MHSPLALLLALAAAAYAQNLLNNADFSQHWKGNPTDWKTNIAVGEDGVTLLPQAGPNGENAVRINLGKTIAFGQGGIRLVQGEAYKLGAYVRTKNFKCSRGGVSIANYNWENETQSQPFPADTRGQWLKIENEVVCQPQSPNEYRFGSNVYSFQIFATSAEGECEVASPYLVPASENAFRGSSRARSFMDYKDIIPVAPLLDKIPAENAVLDVFYPYADNVAIAGYIGSAKATGTLKDHRCKLTFPSLPVGRAILTLYARDSATGKDLTCSDYLATVIPVIRPTPARRLNNLVCELFSQPARDGVTRFSLKDGTWLFIQLGKGKAALDGRELPLETYQGKQETMVYANWGEHALTLSETAGDFVLRTIPEVFLHPFKTDDSLEYAKGFCSVGFLKRHLAPAVNMFNFNSTWRSHYRQSIGGVNDMRKTSRALIGSGGMAAKKWDDSKLICRELDCDGSTYFLGGRTIDELNASAHVSRLWAVADALWLHRRFGPLLYTWLEHGGMMNDPQYHTNLIAAQANASNGRGKFLAECYIATFDTPERQLAESDRLRRSVAATSAFYPDYAKRLLVISGGYQIPYGGITNACYPQSDPKCSQDMFFNACATAPELDGLYGIGMYSFLNSDEENARWYGALFRHYAIEGRTSLLAKDLGFAFNPSHIANCDFEDGLASWRTEGTVTAGKISGFGKYQGRSWRKAAAPGIGDTVAILQADAQNAASVSQDAVNLKPGLLYSVTYLAADRKTYDAKAKRDAKDRLIELKLGNADIIEVQDFDFFTRDNALVSCKVIFKAKAATVPLAFTALPGVDGAKRDILLNYIALRPYFQDAVAAQ